MRQWFLEAIASQVEHRPKRLLAIAAVLALVAAATLPGLGFSASRRQLIDPSDPDVQRLEQFFADFGTSEVMIAMVEGGSPREQQAVVDRFAQALRADPQIRDVLAQLRLQFFMERGLFFIGVDQLDRVSEAMATAGLDPQALRKLLTLSDVLAMLDRQVSAGLEGDAAGSLTEKLAGLTVLRHFFTSLEAQLRKPSERAEVFRPYLAELLARRTSSLDDRGYFTSRDGSLRFLFIRPTNPSDSERVVLPFVDTVRRAARKAEEGETRIRLTGIPAMQADELGVLARDLPLTGAVALLGVAILLVVGFRSGLQVLLGLVPLLLGVVLTFCFVRFAFGVVNLVTSVFLATLIGLGIDFAVHLLSRHNEGREQGLQPAAAASRAVSKAGPGIVTSALTTAAAFFATQVCDFAAIAQLGLITGVGLLCCAASTLTVLPSLLALGVFQHARPRPFAGFGGHALAAYVVRRGRRVVILCAVAATALLGAKALDVRFSWGLTDLLPASTESVAAANVMSQTSDFSSEMGVMVAGSVEEARTQAAKLRPLATVVRVESPADFVPVNQNEKAGRLARLREQLGALTPPMRSASEPDLDRIGEQLISIQDGFEEAEYAAGVAMPEIGKALGGVAKAVSGVRDAIEGAGSVAKERLTQFQTGLLSELDEALRLLGAALAAKPFTLQDVPGEVRDRFLSADGRVAIYVTPAERIGDRAFLGRFVTDLQSVSPEATGFPVTYYTFSGTIRRGFQQAGFLSLGVIVIMFLIDFRRLKESLLALLPLALGVTWMHGGMAVVGLEYNLGNLVGVPLVVGIGVAGGVHLLHRLRQEGDDVDATERAIRGTWSALVLSAATTMVGFGSLALASHGGISSLGLILLLGVGACLVSSTLVLPAVIAAVRGLRS